MCLLRYIPQEYMCNIGRGQNLFACLILIQGNAATREGILMSERSVVVKQKAALTEESRGELHAQVCPPGYALGYKTKERCAKNMMVVAFPASSSSTPGWIPSTDCMWKHSVFESKGRRNGI